MLLPQPPLTPACDRGELVWDRIALLRGKPEKAGQNTKVSLDRGHAAVGRGSESEENTNLFVAPHFAPACEAEGAVLNPIAPSLSFMPEYIKTNSSLNCFHTEMKLLISYDSTF